MIGLGVILSNAVASPTRPRFCSTPSFKTTSCLTVVLLVCLETVLLSTVSNCAKTFYMHWNTTNSIFRIDNTDHIIDVNKGNLAFEFDQVHIICPVYEPGTFENETEKYIIYNVSKVEYETCRITNANPRIIAICDKPQKLMFFTITFRPFTPQPGGLEFLPGNDYYFISTSSRDDLHRRIGGRCSTNNMKVVFKVCCSDDEKRNSAPNTSKININTTNNGGTSINNGAPINEQTQFIGTSSSSSSDSPGVPKFPIIYSNVSNVVQSTMSWPSWSHPQSTPITSTLSIQPFYPYMTSPRPTINSAINNNYNYDSNDTLNNNDNKNNTYNNNSNNKHKNKHILNNNNNSNIKNNFDNNNSSSNIYNNNKYNFNNYNINNNNDNFNSNLSYSNKYINNSYNNNSPSHKPAKKLSEYDKHPNEVVKNEELTYSNTSSGIHNTNSLINKINLLILLVLVIHLRNFNLISNYIMYHQR